MTEQLQELRNFLEEKALNSKKAAQYMRKGKAPILAYVEEIKKKLTDKTDTFLCLSSQELIYAYLSVYRGTKWEQITEYVDIVNNLYKNAQLTKFEELNDFEIEFFEWIGGYEPYLETIQSVESNSKERMERKAKKIEFDKKVRSLLSDEDQDTLSNLHRDEQIFNLLYSIALLKYEVVNSSEVTMRAFFANKKKQTNTCLYDAIKEQYDLALEMFHSYIEIYPKKENEKINQLKRNSDFLYSVSRKLEQLSSQYIGEKEIRGLQLENILNEKEKEKFIQTILEHNQLIYRGLITEVEEQLERKELSPIERYLLENKFPVRNLGKTQRELLRTYGTMEEIETILPFLQEKPFNEMLEKSDYLIDLLIGTTKEKLEVIRSLYDKAQIRTTFIKEHPEIWVKEEEECLEYHPTCSSSFSVLCKNLDLFNKERVDVQNLFVKDLLLYPTTNLKSTIGMLKKYYNLGFKANESDGSLKVLQDPALFDLLDQYIELGIYDYAKENSRLIDSAKVRGGSSGEAYDPIVERFLCYQIFGLPTMNKNGRLETTIGSGNGFFFEREELIENLHPDATEQIPEKHLKKLDNSCRTTIQSKTMKTSAIATLEETCKVDALRYVIGDTTISRPKVLRNFDCLKRNYKEDCNEVILLSSIFYHSYLSYDQQENIKTQIGNKVYQKRR